MKSVTSYVVPTSNDLVLFHVGCYTFFLTVFFALSIRIWDDFLPDPKHALKLNVEYVPVLKFKNTEI
jgi:hypothetical protein